MKERNLFEELEQIGKCPNCDEESFLINKGFCTNCEYGKNSQIIKNKVKNNLSENLSPKQKNFIFKDGKLESYKISVLNKKITEIKFKFGKYRFLIGIKYNLNKKIIKETNFYETEKDEKEKIFEKIEINGLKIIGIFRKVKSGYGEKKKSVNYFNFLGLNNYQVYNFTKNLLKNFHLK